MERVIRTSPTGLEIRRKYLEGATQEELAIEYGLSKPRMTYLVGDISKGYGRYNQSGKVGPSSKFSPEQIREIRTLRDKGWTLQSIGDKFGVTKEYIRQITKREIWENTK